MPVAVVVVPIVAIVIASIVALALESEAGSAVVSGVIPPVAGIGVPWRVSRRIGVFARRYGAGRNSSQNAERHDAC
jgi:hypothetical protein